MFVFVLVVLVVLGRSPPLGHRLHTQRNTQTNNQINVRNKHKHTNAQTHEQTNKQKKTNKQTNKQTHNQTHKQTTKQTLKQTKQTNKQTNKQLKQTHKQTNTQQNFSRDSLLGGVGDRLGSPEGAVSFSLCMLVGPIKSFPTHACTLTWLVLGGDPAVRSRRVEQFTAL